MARKKTPVFRLNARAALSSRLREVRHEVFGYHGGPELARLLSLPARTWYNYETGVTVPAEVLLAFVEQTGTNPGWLLRGEGPKYRHQQSDAILSESISDRPIRRGLEAGQTWSVEAPPIPVDSMTGESTSGFISISLIPLSALAVTEPRAGEVEGEILAFRQWIPNPAQTVAVRIDDDAMDPILPVGSIVAIDRTLSNPWQLQGRLVAADPDGQPMIRWLDVSGHHLILRPQQPSREHPLIPLEWEGEGSSPIIGNVVWSWSRFGGQEPAIASTRRGELAKSSVAR